MTTMVLNESVEFPVALDRVSDLHFFKITHIQLTQYYPLLSIPYTVYPAVQIGAIVCLLVLIVGFTLMKPSGGNKAKSTPKKKAPAKSWLSPSSAKKVTKKAAKGSGSVATPAGRRSARIARKSMDKDN